MHARIAVRLAARPPTCNNADDIRCTLHGSLLHIVQYAADSTHFFAAAGATGSAVHQVRQRRPMAGRLLGAVPIHDQHPTVIRREAEYQTRRDCIVRTEYGPREAAFSATRQGNGIVDRAIRDDCTDGPEGFHRMNWPGTRGIRTQEEHRRDESTALAIAACRLEVFRIARDQFRVTAELLHLLEHLTLLRDTRKRPHAHVFKPW